MTRYIRQTMLPEIGSTGQEKLTKSNVVVVGAGGLGCPVLSYLSGAGIGKITIIDPDVVEESNLHRQPLYSMDCIGKSKALSAKSMLERYNPQIEITTHVTRLDPSNVQELTHCADIIIDAADSFAVTYMLSDLCLKTGQVLISASVLGFSGYVGGFCGNQVPSIRSVFPNLPKSGQTCSTAGVSGPAVGVLGALQAQMAMNCILKLEPSPLGQMVTLDLKQLSTNSFSFINAQEPKVVFEFVSTKDIKANDFVVELRPYEEAPEPVIKGAYRCSVDQIETQINQTHNRRTILCCRSGLRAWNAAVNLQTKGVHNIALIALG